MSLDDSLLAPTDIEEALSVAYVHAVASVAGYAVAQRNFDRDSIDLTIEAGGRARPRLDLQLKATINLSSGEDGRLKYVCKKKNYEDLRIETQVPRLLVVLHLPRERTEWMSLTQTELIIRHCAYWASLKGSPATDTDNTVTIYIPESNLFDVETLKTLMEQSRSGRIT